MIARPCMCCSCNTMTPGASTSCKTRRRFTGGAFFIAGHTHGHGRSPFRVPALRAIYRLFFDQLSFASVLGKHLHSPLSSRQAPSRSCLASERMQLDLMITALSEP